MADPLASLVGDPIQEQFSKIHGMFEKTPTAANAPSNNAHGNQYERGSNFAWLGGPISGLLFGHKSGGDPANPQEGSLNPEAVTGDSLTQYMRSLTNYMGTKGEGTFDTGTGMLGLGTDIVGKGLAGFEAPTSYYSKILSGDPNSISEIMNPESRVINANYDNALKQAKMTLPRSGYASQQEAELPFQKAGQLTQLLQGIRPGAAKSLTDIAQLISGIGQGQQQVGLGEQGMGSNLLSNAIQSLLTRRAQNVGVDTANKQEIVSGISNLV